MRLGVGRMAVVVFGLALAVPAAAGAAFGPLGDNFRISFMGPDGNPDYGVNRATVAYNPAANEYLVAWTGDDNTAPLVDNEGEIFAQRLSGSGALLGGRIRVSAQGADGDPSTEVGPPSVAYNAASNEYLVVWEGEIGTSEDFEIWGQRLSATGEEVGGDFQISNMGPGGGASYSAFAPSAAVNPGTGEYLVVWSGDQNMIPLVDEEFEVFGQRLTAAGAEVDPNDFRISDMGPDGSASYGAFNPNVAYNAAANEFLVAWEGDDALDGEVEIFAQRLTVAGVAVGSNDFPISDIGPDGNAAHDAEDPVVAANPATGEYVVVWEGDDLANQEFSVFAQRLSAGGAQVGGNDIRVSDQGADGDPASDAENPSVAYGGMPGEYLVVWAGDSTAGLVDSEFEIWAQRLSSTGEEVGGDLRVSQMGPDGDVTYTGQTPSVAAHPTASEYLVVWGGDDDTPPLVANEREVFGQRLGEPPPAPAFGARTLVTLSLAAKRIPARGPLRVRVANGNAFEVTGTLSARVLRSKIRLKARAFSVTAQARKVARLKLPPAARRRLARTGRLTLRLTAKLEDPAGNTRTASKKVTVRLKR